MSIALYFGIAIIAGGVSGVLCGILWVARARQDNRARHIDRARVDLANALDSAQKVLQDARTPSDLRQTIFMLLETIAEPSFGDVFSKAFAETVPSSDAPDGPLVMAMRNTAEIDAGLERDAHRAIVGILLGLMYIHGRQMFAAQHEAATDPDSVWARVGHVLGNSSGPKAHGGRPIAV